MAREKRERRRSPEQLAKLFAYRDAVVQRVKEEVDLHVLAKDLGGVPIREGGELRYLFGEKGARSHRVKINGQLWKCPHTGGGDAFSLVRSVRGGTFQEALAFLKDTYLRGAPKAMPAAKPAVARPVESEPTRERVLMLPQPDPEAWPRARRHLVEGRGISAEIVDAAHRAGDLFAAAWTTKNGGKIPVVAMLARDENGRAVGAEIKSLAVLSSGKRMSIMAPGSEKSAGSFRVGGPIEKAQAVGVVEGGIDAMAALTVLRSRGDDRSWTIVSSAGEGKLAQGVMSRIPDAARRYAMQDRDDAGDRMAEGLNSAGFGGWQRLSPAPSAGKDWADMTAEARSQQLSQIRVSAGRDEVPAVESKNGLSR